VALRRLGVVVILTGTFALVWALVATTARTASATQVCTKFDVTGAWTFVIPNHSYRVVFHQDSAGKITGELFYSPAEVGGFGYPPGTRFPITSGSMNGDQLTFEDTPTQPKTDGTGAHVGVYSAEVTASSPERGVVHGQAHDKQVPSRHFAFSGTGPAHCLAFGTSSPVGPNDRLIVTFNPVHEGIRGRIQVATVGAKDAHGGYRVLPTFTGGTPESLRVTRGVFGQHLSTLGVISGRYEPAFGFTAETLMLHVRVADSTDSSCPAGAHGLLTAYHGHRGQRGVVINLCGATVHIRSEEVFFGVMESW
jgi:hypothetical protein